MRRREACPSQLMRVLPTNRDGLFDETKPAQMEHTSGNDAEGRRCRGQNRNAALSSRIRRSRIECPCDDDGDVDANPTSTTPKQCNGDDDALRTAHETADACTRFCDPKMRCRTG